MPHPPQPRLVGCTHAPPCRPPLPPLGPRAAFLQARAFMGADVGGNGGGSGGSLALDTAIAPALIAAVSSTFDAASAR
jgi:hypothetical protein